MSRPSLGPNLSWTFKRLKHSSNYIERERKKRLHYSFYSFFLGGSEITESVTIETEPIFANETRPDDGSDDINQDYDNKPDKDVLFTAKTTFNYTAMVIDNYSAAFLIKILLTLVKEFRV